MSAKSLFLSEERKSIEQSVTMVDGLLARESMSQYEVIALGTLLQNIYTGIESIVRYRLQEQGHKIQKTENWHKELLLKAKENNHISEPQFNNLLELLLFRHLHVHGYGYMLDEKRLRELARPVHALCDELLKGVE